MNKQEFIATLQHYLSALPEEERNELLRDYEAHFIYGQQHGKSEDEIARELGDPLALAREIVGPDFLAPPPWTPPRRDIPRTIAVTIMLIFMNLIVAIPVFSLLWSVFAAFCAATLAGLISPFVLVLEQVLYGDYTNHKLFIAIGMFGIGMLLAAWVRALGRWLILITAKYGQWNINTWKGRS
jgi:uncharacterized membrane protein